MKSIDRTISRLVRAACGCQGKPYPIEERDGFDAPKLCGESCHWTTPGGRPVYYPNAYRRSFGRPVYHPSTLHITVGRGWITQALHAHERRQERICRLSQRLIDRFGAALVTMADSCEAGNCSAGAKLWCESVGIDPTRPTNLASVIRGYRRRPLPGVMAVVRRVLTRARKRENCLPNSART